MSTLFADQILAPPRILIAMRWVLAVTLATGCQLVDDRQTAERGEPCDRDTGCKAGTCRGGICSGGTCKPIDPLCGAGFQCVFYDGGFFGSDSYSCEMLCSGPDEACPDWYGCSEHYCQYTSLKIAYTPEVVLINEPVTFTGLFFEDKPRRSADWLIDTGTGFIQMEGETATVSFENPRAVTVTFTAAYENDADVYRTQTRLMVP